MSFIDKLANSYIILLIVGFFFIGTIPKLIGFSGDSWSIQYRIIILGLSLFFIFSSIFSKRYNRINLSTISLFLVFWAIYSIRIIYDLYIDPIRLLEGTIQSQYFQFAFGVIMIPSIALLFVIQTYKIDLNWVLKWLYVFLILVLSITLYYRSDSKLEGRTAGDINVGILQFGQYGATLSILSIYYLVNNNNLKNTWYYISGFIIGFIGILVSASKSPFLAFIAVIALFLILWYKNIKPVFFIVVSGILLNSYFVEIVTFMNNYFNSNFLDRLLYAIEMGGDKIRVSLIKISLEEFIANPVFGNAMLIQQGESVGSYPHNLIVEAFMATGVIGGGFFFLWIVRCLKVAIRIIRIQSKTSWTGLLFLQYLIFGMFSGNLYSSDLFWFFSIFLVAINRMKINISPN